MELQFTKPKPDAVEFTFEDATETFLTALPKVRDPYEKRMVYIGDSVLPGEGLFSKVKSTAVVVVVVVDDDDDDVLLLRLLSLLLLLLLLCCCCCV